MILHYRWARLPDRRYDLAASGALATVFPAVAPAREARLAIHATNQPRRVTCRRCRTSAVFRRAQNLDGDP